MAKSKKVTAPKKRVNRETSKASGIAEEILVEDRQDKKVKIDSMKKRLKAAESYLSKVDKRLNSKQHEALTRGVNVLRKQIAEASR